MRGGEIVEWGDGDTVTSAPTHPYTQRLLLASPVADPTAQAERRRLLQAATPVSPAAAPDLKDIA
jgi:ABC-type oligopeptide transport system ATPase subunit